MVLGTWLLLTKGMLIYSRGESTLSILLVSVCMDGCDITACLQIAPLHVIQQYLEGCLI